MKDNGFLLPQKQYRIEYLILKFIKHSPQYEYSKKIY